MPWSVLMTTTTAPTSWANGPRYRQRRGSKSESNFGAAVGPGRPLSRTGDVSTDTIFSFGWATVGSAARVDGTVRLSAAARPAAVNPCRNRRRFMGGGTDQDADDLRPAKGRQDFAHADNQKDHETQYEGDIAPALRR